MAMEIWKATGYRFTCAFQSSTIYFFALNGGAELKITHNFPTDTRHDFGAPKMKHIDLSPREPLGKPRVTSTNHDNRVQGSLWRRTASHVGVGC